MCFILSVWAFFDRSINTGIKRTKIDQKIGQKNVRFRNPRFQNFTIFQILKIFIFDIFSALIDHLDAKFKVQKMTQKSATIA